MVTLCVSVYSVYVYQSYFYSRSSVSFAITLPTNQLDSLTTRTRIGSIHIGLNSIRSFVQDEVLFILLHPSVFLTSLTSPQHSFFCIYLSITPHLMHWHRCTLRHLTSYTRRIQCNITTMTMTTVTTILNMYDAFLFFLFRLYISTNKPTILDLHHTHHRLHTRTHTDHSVHSLSLTIAISHYSN